MGRGGWVDAGIAGECTVRRASAVRSEASRRDRYQVRRCCRQDRRSVGTLAPYMVVCHAYEPTMWTAAVVWMCVNVETQHGGDVTASVRGDDRPRVRLSARGIRARDAVDSAAGVPQTQEEHHLCAVVSTEVECPRCTGV